MLDQPPIIPFDCPLRPPSVPLVVHDPYFSIWSPNEKLAEASTEHWTKAKNRIVVTAKIDGKKVRLVGREPKDAPPLTQTSLHVHPTRTVANFIGHGVNIELSFVSPALPSDLDLFSRPLTYVAWKSTSTDSGKHDIAIQVRAAHEIAASRENEPAESWIGTFGKARFCAVRAKNQRVLQRAGDQITTDWGTLYVAAEASTVTEVNASCREMNSDPASILLESRGSSGQIAIAFDDEWSIQYFGQNLRPYWRRNRATAESLLTQGLRTAEATLSKCEQFDREFTADLERTGGREYALLGALSFRQSAGASKLVADRNGQPLWFPKENSSNGCIATVDVIYPMAPIALLFGPSLTRAMLQPVMAYSASNRWTFPFAPHDLGTYPLANGQVYGGGEDTEDNQMPVEESANMLILLAALAKVEGHASYAQQYWKQVTQWAEYLRAKGLDPENQLCTDDFLGHLAHNTNLSLKAILGLRAYADLAGQLNLTSTADEYLALSRAYAKRWLQTASEREHTRLTFDRPDTWSQKYNLVWDRILGYNLFPPSLARSEMAWYRRQLNTFGTPLDNRGSGAKLDWSLWTATLTRNREDFEALVHPLFGFANESPQRFPLSDWFDTRNGHMNFFHARSVVGGLFLPLLYDQHLWASYARRDTNRAGSYAPIPNKIEYDFILPAADCEAAIWKWTEQRPAANWIQSDFDDRTWRSGRSGFGSLGTPGARVGTSWTSGAIWLRREFDLRRVPSREAKLWLHHDEEAKVYINGQLAVSVTGYTTKYQAFSFDTKLLRKGRNVIAIECLQTRGGQYIDLGIGVPKR